MKHELSRSEEPGRGVLLVLRDLVTDTQSTLADAALADKSVHQGRKLIKKARATLRLLRDSIPEPVFRRENHALRDIARPLSAARDASVLLDTLDRLERLYGQPAIASIPSALRVALKKERAEMRERIGNPGRASR